ncbi:MAG: CRTAC1 family protein [Proteobacteria bacterium]|nr:CRTAC1 family protein [Pseudomonadota bacterium]
MDRSSPVGTCTVLFALAVTAGTHLAAAAPEQPAGHERMVAQLAELSANHPHGFDYAGEARQARLLLESLPDDAEPALRATFLAEVGTKELEAGINTGLARLIEAFDLATRIEGPERRGYMLPLAYQIGVAYYRMARLRSCVDLREPGSCTIPGGAPFRDSEARDQAVEAIRYLRVVLDATPQEAPRHATALWLTNLAYMSLGQHPEAIPERYRIPAHAFQGAPFRHFEEVATPSGLDARGYAGGAIAEDFDRDGLIDLMVASVHPNYQIRLFLNDGLGGFRDATAASGLTGITSGLHIVQTDYNNDGYADVFVPRGGWLKSNGRHPNSLLRNNGDATFTDVTIDAGLADVHYPTQTMTWADFDNDGDLDLFVGNEFTPDQPSPCQLFRNEGDGTFVDIAESAGVTNNRFTKAVAAGDYDSDGHVDLFVSNMDQINRLYHNNGDGTFTDVAAAAGVEGPMASFSSWFWDANNDGHQDLMVTSYSLNGPRHPLAEIALNYLGTPSTLDHPTLYLGDGTGGFKDVSGAWGLSRSELVMGSNYGDLDNDGYLDFYLGTGFMTYEAVMPNIMMRNVRGKGFEDVSADGGFGHLAKAHGIAFADFDNDGDQDVFTRLGGALIHDSSFDVLYRNPGFGNRFLTLTLKGTRANRSGIGARLKVDIVEGGNVRSVYHTVGNGSSFGGNPLRAEIGLGLAERVLGVHIVWPGSGTRQVIEHPPLNSFLEVTEGAQHYTTVDTPSFVENSGS